MAVAHLDRRLLAILAADVVGYSRLMEADEPGTIARLKAIRTELAEPLVAEHHGRIVKLMGDGVLVVFESVVDAVACAVAIQKAVSERNSTMLEAERIVFRIGINLGDVALVDGDVYGDGVNVAARLEQLCDPGGVLISGTAYDHLKGKLDLRLEPRGVQHLKNIHEPVRVYRVASIGAGSARRPTREAASARERVARRWRWVAAASLTLLLLLALAAWLRPWQPAVEAASLERMAFPLPDKPSIAVLPFKNMSGEAEQEYFADGLTDDLITDLSKISGLFVIARNSVFELKGRDVKVHEAAERLGVRYVVEGSVRRAGNDVRVNVQLVDATTGGQLWAERYDGSLDDIFAVQDRLVRVIVDALALNLSPEEEREIGRGQTNNLDAREAFQKGWERVLRFTDEANAAGIADLDGRSSWTPTMAEPMPHWGWPIFGPAPGGGGVRSA